MSKFLDKHSKLKAAFAAAKGTKKGNIIDAVATGAALGVAAGALGIEAGIGVIVAGAILPALGPVAIGVVGGMGIARVYRAIKAAKKHAVIKTYSTTAIRRILVEPEVPKGTPAVMTSFWLFSAILCSRARWQAFSTMSPKLSISFV